MSGVIAVCVIDGLIATIKGQGIDSSALSARVGLGDDLLFGDPYFRPLVTFTSLLEIAASVRNDPVLGLRLGKAFDFRRLGPMGQLFLTARTVGEALEKFTHYFPVLQSNTQCSLRVEDAVARLSYSIRDSTIRHRSQDANFTELVFCSMLVALLGDDWRPSSVRFEHLPGSHFELYKPYFHCSISFGERENAIQFSARDLDTAIPHSNHIAHSHAEAAIREPRSKEIARLSFSAGIKAWIIESLSNPTDIDIETAVTRHLGVRIRNSVL